MALFMGRIICRVPWVYVHSYIRWFEWILVCNILAFPSSMFFNLGFIRVGSLWSLVSEARMQACTRPSLMGSLQQPIWIEHSRFPSKGCGVIGFSHQVKLNLVKPCRSYTEGSLVTGKPPSSVSVPKSGGSLHFTINWFLLLLWVYHDCLRKSLSSRCQGLEFTTICI